MTTETPAAAAATIERIEAAQWALERLWSNSLLTDAESVSVDRCLDQLARAYDRIAETL